MEADNSLSGTSSIVDECSIYQKRRSFSIVVKLFAKLEVACSEKIFNGACNILMTYNVVPYKTQLFFLITDVDCFEYYR